MRCLARPPGVCGGSRKATRRGIPLAVSLATCDRVGVIEWKVNSPTDPTLPARCPSSAFLCAYRRSKIVFSLRYASTMARDCVKIVEVGPRDGLQNINKVIPTATKVELIKKLSRTGLQTIEATSFVSPKWVPQLSDAKEVMNAIRPLLAQSSISFPVLVPNLIGLEAASQMAVKEIGIFLSASEGFSRKNINCSVAESLVRAKVVVEKALASGIRVRAYVWYI
jgi:hypothetical protein